MKLTYAIIADAAQVSDGKLFLLGGEFDTIRTSVFPALHHQLSLVLKFEVTRQECDKDHRLQVKVVGPLGSMSATGTGVFRPMVDATHPERAIKVLLVINLQNLLFETPGTYAIRISVDGTGLGATQLHLEKL